MDRKQPIRIRTISEFHKACGLSNPGHPLVSLIDYAAIDHLLIDPEQALILDFYSVTLKKDSAIKMIYGQQSFDFDAGVMFFMAPDQILRVQREEGVLTERSGWILLIHPDFLWNTPLAKTIRQYEYFHYSIHEALFLSEKEELMLHNIALAIQSEYQGNLDALSQSIIVAHLEAMFNYAQRFYQRQFITRKMSSHQLLVRLEDLLESDFSSDELSEKGLPTVQSIAERLNVSAGYLSSLLKQLTGKSTQQHIQDKVIEKAKEKLSTTNLSVGEIAFQLGFEHPQSFNKLFKVKTKLSPLSFRSSFN